MKTEPRIDLSVTSEQIIRSAGNIERETRRQSERLAALLEHLSGSDLMPGAGDVETVAYGSSVLCEIADIQSQTLINVELIKSGLDALFGLFPGAEAFDDDEEVVEDEHDGEEPVIVRKSKSGRSHKNRH